MVLLIAQNFLTGFLNCLFVILIKSLKLEIMKFLKWLGIIVFIIIALFLIIPVFLPSTFHIERSITVDKSVDLAFKTAVNMNQRAKWDPWIEMDPEAEIIVDMNPNIIGSEYSWNSEIIGEGKITIQEFKPNELIKSKIEFISPRGMESDVIWNFEDIESGTIITWAFEGNLSYPVEKWFGLFIEKSLGPQFEKGLNNFQVLIKKLPDFIGQTGEIKEYNFEGLKAIAIKEKCETKKLSSKMIDMYSSLMSYLKSNDIEISDAPFAIYHEYNEYGNTILECGIPITENIADKENIKVITIPASKTIMASHFGHYKTVKITYKALQKYIEDNNLEVIGSPWESYITDPMKEPDQNKWETHVFFPIK